MRQQETGESFWIASRSLPDAVLFVATIYQRYDGENSSLVHQLLLAGLH